MDCTRNAPGRRRVPLGQQVVVCFLFVLLFSLPVLGANPVPFVNLPVVPGAVPPGGAQFTLTVNGTGFVNGSVVNWNGGALITTYVSAGQLTAVVPAARIASPGTASISVTSPPPGGGVSNVAFFQVTSATSSVTLSRTDFPTRAQPNYVTVGDFNADGELDLAVANAGDNTVSILLGNGDGSFQTQTTYATGSTPVSVTTGDFNGDGKLDLAVPNYFDNAVSILLGNGDGTFQTQTTFATGANPVSVTTGDFNGDGKLDLAIANSNLNSVSILLGNGDGTFQTQTTYATGKTPGSVTTGDFNGDGKLDLAIANSASNSVSILLGNGDGTFQTQTTFATGTYPYSVTTGDFNGDGILDLAVANSNCFISPCGGGSVSVLLGNGDGTFQTQTTYATGGRPQSVTTGDFNGDGKLDLAVANVDDNTVSILLGNGDGTFQTQTSYATGADPLSLTTGDLNGHGSLDLAVANYGANTVSILLQVPIASLSGTSLTFANQLLGTSSSTQSVTLTNPGSANLVISTVALGGPNPGDFTMGENCSGTTVAPSGPPCTINVTFSPTAVGGRIATITITDNDNNVANSTQIILLSGTGTSATSVSLSVTSLTFSGQGVGTPSAPQPVTLTNIGTGPLTVSSMATSGDFAQTNNCGASVAAAASCTISVTFTPAATGTRTGTLTITDNNNGVAGSTQSVALSGTGQDFSFGPPSGSSTSATVAPGLPATYTLSVRGEGGLSGTVSFTCAGAPSEATCTVSPNPVTVGSSATNVTVIVTTTAPSVSVPRSRPLPPVPPLSPGLRVLLMLALVLAAMAWAVMRRNRPGVSARQPTMLPLALALLLTLGLAGCGGGGGGGGPSNPGTPAGTYSLRVTGSTGSGSSALSHSVTLTLTVS